MSRLGAKQTLTVYALVLCWSVFVFWAGFSFGTRKPAHPALHISQGGIGGLALIVTNVWQRKTQITTDSFPQHLSDTGKVCLGGFFSRKANACPTNFRRSS